LLVCFDSVALFIKIERESDNGNLKRGKAPFITLCAQATSFE
jgi:hypothetical protein